MIIRNTFLFVDGSKLDDAACTGEDREITLIKNMEALRVW